MRCKEFDVRLQQLLDRRMVPESDALVVTHGKECTRCRRLLRAQRTLFRELQRGMMPSCEDDFDARVLARLRCDQKARGSRRYAWSAAAAAVLALAVVFQSMTSIDLVKKDTNASKNTSAVATSQTAEVMMPRGDDLSAVQQTVTPSAVARYSRLRAPNTEFPRMMSQWQAQLRTVGSLWIGHEDDAVGERDWMGAFAGGLKPLADSMSSALHVLRGTIGIDGDKDNRSDGPQVHFLRTNTSHLVA